MSPRKFNGFRKEKQRIRQLVPVLPAELIDSDEDDISSDDDSYGDPEFRLSEIDGD